METTTTGRAIRTEADALAYIEASGLQSLFEAWRHECPRRGLVVRIPNPCQRCGGSGNGGWFQDGGICYECNGADTRKRAKVLTVKAWAQAEKRQARARARRDDERRAAAERTLEAQRDWCEANGYGRLTFAERDQVREEQRRAELAASGHVGTVGTREVFEVEVTGVPTWETAYGTTWCHLMRDKDGNVLVWRSSTASLVVPCGFEDAGRLSWNPETETGERMLRKGDRVRILGTVKKHGERDGCKQTELTRCKLAEVVELVGGAK